MHLSLSRARTLTAVDASYRGGRCTLGTPLGIPTGSGSDYLKEIGLVSVRKISEGVGANGIGRCLGSDDKEGWKKRLRRVDVGPDGNCGVYVCAVLWYALHNERISRDDVRKKLIEEFKRLRTAEENDLEDDEEVAELKRFDQGTGCIARLYREDKTKTKKSKDNTDFDGVLSVDRQYKFGEKTTVAMGMYDFRGLYNDEIEDVVKFYVASHHIGDESKTRFLTDWELSMFARHMSLNLVVILQDKSQRYEKGGRQRFVPRVVQYTPESVGYAFILNTHDNQHWELLAQAEPGEDKDSSPVVCPIFSVEDGESLLKVLMNVMITNNPDLEIKSWDAYKMIAYDPCYSVNMVTVDSNGLRSLDFINLSEFEELEHIYSDENHKYARKSQMK